MVFHGVVPGFRKKELGLEPDEIGLFVLYVFYELLVAYFF